MQTFLVNFIFPYNINNEIELKFKDNKKVQKTSPTKIFIGYSSQKILKIKSGTGDWKDIISFQIKIA